MRATHYSEPGWACSLCGLGKRKALVMSADRTQITCGQCLAGLPAEDRARLALESMGSVKLFGPAQGTNMHQSENKDGL